MNSTDDKRGARVPIRLWDAFAEVVGYRRRSADLRRYMEWRIEHPRQALAEDPGADAGPVRKMRVEDALWVPYAAAVGGQDCSADLRAYMAWRVKNPSTPLPGRSPVTVRYPRVLAAA